jgi:hypothetical protein
MREGSRRTAGDVVNFNILILVALSFFLPMVVVTCNMPPPEGPIEIKYTGANLAFGTEPKMYAGGQEKSGGEKSDFTGTTTSPGSLDQKPKSDENKDPLALVIPIFAALAAFASMAVFVSGRKPGKANSLAMALIIPVLAAYGFFAVVGYKIEREYKKAIKESSSKEGSKEFAGAMESFLTVKKTGYFYLGLLATIVSLILAALPAKRPPPPVAQPPPAPS